jgi:prolipoprotein diacylglyceryltransferase
MYPVVFEAGPITIDTLTLGILAGLGIIAWRAYRTNPTAVARWLDVAVAAVVIGLIGARALHVLLEWDYFADHTDEITKIRLGGMAWHGALLTGIPAALGVAWLRRVPLRPWTDALALAWPVGLMLAWWGCREAACGYGYEVRTLADWPGWLVEELPDIYRLNAPRLDIQLGGIVFGGVLLVLALVMTWRGWLPGLRLWVIWALSGLGLALLGFFRADPAQMLYNRRADQVFDLILLLLSTVIGGTLWLHDRREEAQTDEDYAGPGPDQAPVG